MNVPLRIINDHISEPTEGLTLKLVIPKVTSDNISIKQGVNSIAEGVIINSGKVILLTAINHVNDVYLPGRYYNYQLAGLFCYLYGNYSFSIYLQLHNTEISS